MEPTSKSPTSTETSPAAPVQPGQTGPTGVPPAAPEWSGQAGPMGVPPTVPAQSNQRVPPGYPPAAPASAEQLRTPQRMPAWVGQSTPLPPGVQPVLLERGSTWPTLRFISLALKLLAWIGVLFAVILAIVGAGVGVLSVLPPLGFLLVIGFLGLTVICFLAAYGLAELILVFIAIEKNTGKKE